MPYRVFNPPSKPGLYWARDSIAAEWHLVVLVTGESPFFNVDRMRVKTTVKCVPNALDMPRQLIFGPEIIPPLVPPAAG